MVQSLQKQPQTIYKHKSVAVFSETLFTEREVGRFWLVHHNSWTPGRDQWMEKDDPDYIGDLPGQKWKKIPVKFLQAHSYEGQKPALLSIGL